MNIKEVEQKLSTGLLDIFQKYGFSYNKKLREFTRKNKDVEQVLKLFYYKKKDYITIEPEIKIHINAIESIYQSITEIDSRPYLTLGNDFLQIRDYDGDAANFRKKPSKEWLIENAEDIQNLIEIIPQYLEEIILPYFESNSSVAKVDELLNQYPEKMSVHNYLYPLRANIAIIAAKLNGNTKYKQLLKIYEDELIDADEEYKREFCKLKDILENYNT